MIRKEGEVWVEKGKTWTIHNGIKRTVSKFSSIRKTLRTPICCPKCNKSMKHVDEQVYKFNSVCLDCTIDFEHQLKIDGKYDDYERARILANAKGYVVDMDKFFNEYFQEVSDKSYVTEDGDVEAWLGDPSKKVKEVVKPELDRLKKELIDGNTD